VSASSVIRGRHVGWAFPCAQSCVTTLRIAAINLSISASTQLVLMTSLAAAPRQPALDVRGRGPVAAATANVNKRYLSVLFDQLIAQQSLRRAQLQLDRCQQLDSATSAFHYHSSSSRLSTSDRFGIKSMRRAICSVGVESAAASHPRPPVD